MKATGISEKVIDRLTIFSLVKPSKLSNIFEIVAAALRTGNDEQHPPSSDNKADKKEKGTTDSKECKKWDYATMTLPCVKFRVQNGNGKRCNPLYITVSCASVQVKMAMK